MGKSVKKIPIIKDNGSSKKKSKRLANKAVRSKLKNLDYEIADGKAYKKEFESYNIADYVSYWTKDDAINYYYNSSWIDREKYPTLDSWLVYWEKTMLKK